MPGVIVRLPVNSAGVGWGVFDGGINSDPGSQSLFPAIPFGQFIAATGWCDDPVHDAGPPTPQVGVQSRNGYTFIKVTGARPGPSSTVAYVTY